MIINARNYCHHFSYYCRSKGVVCILESRIVYGGQLISDCHQCSWSTDFYTIFIISNRKLHEGKLLSAGAGCEIKDQLFIFLYDYNGIVDDRLLQLN